MLLRASGEQTGENYELNAVTDEHLDAGVPHAGLLRELTEAAVQNRWDDLRDIRDRSSAAFGAQETADALVVAAAFNGITRMADATGIPLDESTEQATVAMRAETGIDSYHYAEKSARYSPASTAT
jgi:hypothetical protein